MSWSAQKPWIKRRTYTIQQLALLWTWELPKSCCWGTPQILTKLECFGCAAYTSRHKPDNASKCDDQASGDVYLCSKDQYHPIYNACKRLITDNKHLTFDKTRIPMSIASKERMFLIMEKGDDIESSNLKLTTSRVTKWFQPHRSSFVAFPLFCNRRAELAWDVKRRPRIYRI